jgi:hypothetical protein
VDECKPLVTGKEQPPKVTGGGHIEHHAETLDDMSIKTDDKWLASVPAKMLETSTYRGTAFEYDITRLMVGSPLCLDPSCLRYTMTIPDLVASVTRQRQGHGMRRMSFN